MPTRHDPFFYADPSQIAADQVLIEGDEVRHLKVVRRARPGDRIQVSDGHGRVLQVLIEEITAKRATGKVLEEILIETPSPRISVFQALTKGAKVDFIVQKLVEIGVDEVIVFVSARSIPKWDAPKAAKALTRWQAVGREAAKQSRRPWLPRIAGPIASGEIPKIDGLVLVADEKSSVRLREALPADPGDRLAVVIGPEGGLDPDDLESFDAHDAKRVQLGPQILRTETAALVVASIVMYHYGLIG